MSYLTQLMLWLGLISIAFIIFVIWAPFYLWLPEGTRQAGEVDNLFKFLLASSGVIFIYVQGLTLGFAVRYRRRKHDADDTLGSQVHGNTRLEVAWTAGPSALLVVMAILTMGVWLDEQAPVHPARNEVQLDVKAFQFGYAFSLPQYGVKNLANVTLPTGRPVHVTETATDVIHSFWVPGFRTQMDAVPGIKTYQYFTPTRVGVYDVVCTQYCGAGHSGMSNYSKVTVATPSDWITWLRKNGATSLPSASSATAGLQQ